MINISLFNNDLSINNENKSEYNIQEKQTSSNRFYSIELSKNHLSFAFTATLDV